MAGRDRDAPLADAGPSTGGGCIRRLGSLQAAAWAPVSYRLLLLLPAVAAGPARAGPRVEPARAGPS